MAKCTAKAKSTGERCTRNAMKGTTVCYVHGGKAALKNRGKGSPNYKHGRYSKHLPERMRERFNESLNDGQLLQLRDEIALIDARLEEVLSSIDGKTSEEHFKALGDTWRKLYKAMVAKDNTAINELTREMNSLVGRGSASYQSWNELSKYIAQRQKLVESERKRYVEMGQMVKLEHSMVAMDRLTNGFIATVEALVKQGEIPINAGKKLLQEASREYQLLISVGE